MRGESLHGCFLSCLLLLNTYHGYNLQQIFLISHKQEYQTLDYHSQYLAKKMAEGIY